MQHAACSTPLRVAPCAHPPDRAGTRLASVRVVDSAIEGAETDADPDSDVDSDSWR
jgi:hypothetical protein